MKRLLVLLVLLAFGLAFVSQIEAIGKYRCHIVASGKCVYGIGYYQCDCADISDDN